MADIALVVDIDDGSFIATEKLLSDKYKLSKFISVADLTKKSEDIADLNLILLSPKISANKVKEILGYFVDKKVPVIKITSPNDDQPITELLNLGLADVINISDTSEILQHRISVQLNLFEISQQLSTTQDQLIQSEKLAALGQLAAGVAHEINNPVGFLSSNMNLIERYLNKIGGELAALQRGCEEETTGVGVLLFATWSAGSKLDEYMKSLKELADESSEGLSRVRDIVKDLKDYSHTGETNFEFADINAMLKSSANLLRNEIKYKAEVVFELAECPQVECIVSQLGQVFVNIIVNACQAIESSGKIKIATKVIATDVVISISDTGEGIDANTLKKVFDPFFTTKPVGKGTGIGLAITHSIIERHNGVIQVDSVVDEGTTFNIQLPLQQPVLI